MPDRRNHGVNFQLPISNSQGTRARGLATLGVGSGKLGVDEGIEFRG
jgi:hypothetical protein